VFAPAGFGRRRAGQAAALLVIDVSWAFCGDKPEPILESTSAPVCGAGELGRVDHIKR